jgi:5-methylcytosine-specific restriction endonuclease McrA
MYDNKISVLRKISKFCSFCQTHLPFEFFSANKSKGDGRNSRCRDCMAEYRKQIKVGETSILIKREEYFIPDIYLVGVGRLQTYQVCCLKCESPFFCLTTYKEREDLFCDKCNVDDSLFKETNISKQNYIGNVIGWIIKVGWTSKKRTQINYKACYQRDKYICQYCGYNIPTATEFRPLHIDHIRPWSSAGGNKLHNLVVSCSLCNLIASDKWFENFEEKKNYINDMLFLRTRRIIKNSLKELVINAQETDNT